MTTRARGQMPTVALRQACAHATGTTYGGGVISSLCWRGMLISQTHHLDTRHAHQASAPDIVDARRGGRSAHRHREHAEEGPAAIAGSHDSSTPTRSILVQLACRFCATHTLKLSNHANEREFRQMREREREREREFRLLLRSRNGPLQTQARGSRLGSL